MFKTLLTFLLFFGKNSETGAESDKNWKLLPQGICGKSNSYRVIGGSEVHPNAFPWIVRIGTKSASLNKVHFSCAGALVSSDTVITAAHCLPFGNITKLGPVRMGEYNLLTDPDCEATLCTKPVFDIDPSIVLAPKEHNASLINNDIAIIKLRKNVTFSESVAPICIGSKKFYHRDFSGKIAEVAGWGYNNVESKNKSVILEAVKIPVLEPQLCKEKYKDKLNVTERHLCAGEPGVDACNGDSGGPLMIVDDGPYGPQYYLLGIVSYGPVHCGDFKYPGVYTNVSAFITWIYDNLDGSGRGSHKIIL